MNKFRTSLTHVLSCLLLALISACSSSVKLQVKGELPTPLATLYPLNLGVHYTDNFLNQIYQENTKERENWNIDYRQPRKTLLDQILPTMFQSVLPVTAVSVPTDGAVIDAILEPDLVETQFALPDETQTDNYEAWIKYTIKLYQPDGKLISEWQLTGYGKTPTAMFTSKTDGLNTAVTYALRDIGARFVLDFRKAPGVQQWIAGKINCAEYPYLC